MCMSGIIRLIGDDTNASEMMQVTTIGIKTEVEVDIWRLR